MDEELYIARKQSITNLKKINWSNGFYRKDIGWRAIKNNNEDNSGKFKK